jgi:hypothetical protein
VKLRLDRIAAAAARVFAPGLARAYDRAEALQEEGAGLRAALAEDLPADHPMSQYVAAWRGAHGAGGAR